MREKLFSRISLDFGNLENEYRREYLETDKARSGLSTTVILVANAGMLGVDYLLFSEAPRLFHWMILYRGLYTLITLPLLAALFRAPDVRTHDRIVFSWLLLTAVYLILFNFTRPPSYLTTAFDIMYVFGVYTLSPLSFQYTVALVISFSAGTLLVDSVYKTPSPVTLGIAISAHVVAHLLGFPSAIQFQTYRHKMFKAYLQEKDAREMANYLIHIDTLTRSLSRQYLLSLAEVEFYRFKRYKRSLSVLYLDLDHFKKLNDRYGHHIGDEALRLFTKVVLEEKRTQDYFGRLGGEEFGLLLPETDLEGATVMAKRIKTAWAKTPIEADERIIHSSVSIGVAEASEKDINFEKLLRRADLLMYKAKRNGRNRIMSK